MACSRSSGTAKSKRCGRQTWRRSQSCGAHERGQPDAHRSEGYSGKPPDPSPLRSLDCKSLFESDAGSSQRPAACATDRPHRCRSFRSRSGNADTTTRVRPLGFRHHGSEGPRTVTFGYADPWILVVAARTEVSPPCSTRGAVWIVESQNELLPLEDGNPHRIAAACAHLPPVILRRTSDVAKLERASSPTPASA